MKVVIDLSDHSYNNIMAVTSMSLGRYPYKGIVMAAINAIKNGTIIPEGHGALHDYIQLKQDIPETCGECILHRTGAGYCELGIKIESLYSSSRECPLKTTDE